MTQEALANDLPDFIPEWLKIRKEFDWNDYAKWDETYRFYLKCLWKFCPAAC